MIHGNTTHTQPVGRPPTKGGTLALPDPGYRTFLGHFWRMMWKMWNFCHMSILFVKHLGMEIKRVHTPQSYSFKAVTEPFSRLETSGFALIFAFANSTHASQRQTRCSVQYQTKTSNVLQTRFCDNMGEEQCLFCEMLFVLFASFCWAPTHAQSRRSNVVQVAVKCSPIQVWACSTARAACDVGSFTWRRWWAPIS